MRKINKTSNINSKLLGKKRQLLVLGNRKNTILLWSKVKKQGSACVSKGEKLNQKIKQIINSYNYINYNDNNNNNNNNKITPRKNPIKRINMNENNNSSDLNEKETKKINERKLFK